MKHGSCLCVWENSLASERSISKFAMPAKLSIWNKGSGRMAKRSIESRGRELLTLARKLAQTPGLTWVEANNAIYGPGGPFVRLFPNAKDRVAFAKTKESQQ